MSETIRRLRDIGRHLVDPDLAAAIVENLPDAIVVVDEPGCIQLFNLQAELMFGYDRTEVYDQPVEMLIPMEHRTNHEAYRRGFMGDPRVRPMGHRHIPLRGIRKNGTEFLAEINLSPLVTREGLLVMAVVRRRGEAVASEA